MTRLTLPFFSLAILLSLLKRGSAGPACAQRNYQAEDCITKCGQMWGWPGSVMQQDPWGAVMKSSSDDLDTVLSKACGISTTAQTSTPSPSATQTVIAVQSKVTGAPLTSSVRTTLTVISSSSSSVISSSSTFSNTTISVRTTSISSSSTHSTKPTSSSSALSSSDALINGANVVFSSSSSFPPTPTLPPPKTTTTTSASRKPSSLSTQPAPSPSPSSTQGSASSSVSSTGSGSSSGSTSSSDIDQYLSAHNSVRAQHGASPLSWSDNLASKAQQWANGCVFQHSGGSLGPFGENLAAGTGDSYDIAAAVKSWTDEVSEYNPSNPVASHFTQVVWKGSTQVGCALQLCDGIFAASFGKAKYYVCEYSAQGNIIGQFAQNVQV
ncbi:PR-1-like protein [Neolentinus lepideus HHB14362 ss-1]|uniref:PR-1-like protein n=1 Tax=Neolentinus lepideus HHB14362 ss-1 TaxID=1314782 RepID=A0A165VXK1_9AGAM|nr:PR-1-like protein [Neolentinus lepideus HHB14362 ss-1]